MLVKPLVDGLDDDGRIRDGSACFLHGHPSDVVVRLAAPLEQGSEQTACFLVDASLADEEPTERGYDAAVLGACLSETQQGSLGCVEGSVVGPGDRLGAETVRREEVGRGKLLAGPGDALDRSAAQPTRTPSAFAAFTSGRCASVHAVREIGVADTVRPEARV